MSRFVGSLLRLFLILLLVVGLITLWELVRGTNALSRFRRDNTPTQQIVLKEITTLGKLELVRYTFKDIVEHEQVNTFLPNGNAVLIVEGEATGCVDLTKITGDAIQVTNDSVLIQLPAPELCNWRINHDHSKVYDTRFTFLDESNVVDKAYQQAEKQIRQSALKGGILTQTQQNADRLLLPLVAQLTGKKVRLSFSNQP